MDKLLLFLIKTISLQPFVPISQRSNDDDNEGNDDNGNDDDGNDDDDDDSHRHDVKGRCQGRRC